MQRDEPPQRRKRERLQSSTIVSPRRGMCTFTNPRLRSSRVNVRACSMSKDKAHTIGATMLFGEKYGENVRAVAISTHNDCEHMKEAWKNVLETSQTHNTDFRNAAFILAINRIAKAMQEKGN